MIKKSAKWIGKEASLEMVSPPPTSRQTHCVNSSYGRPSGDNNSAATLGFPDIFLENVEAGLVLNPMVRKEDVRKGDVDGAELASIRACSGDRMNKNKNEDGDDDEDADLEGNIEDEKNEEIDADILGISNIQGIPGIQDMPCQPPLTDELDMNYLSFSSSSSALHSGSSSYEQRGHRNDSRDDGSDDVLDSVEERNTDTDIYTETSSSKSGAAIHRT